MKAKSACSARPHCARRYQYRSETRPGRANLLWRSFLFNQEDAQAILAQVASAPKGRQWYAQLDLFTPAKRNLVWCMLSLNNAAISAELQGALAALSQPVTVELLTAQDQGARIKAWSDLGDAIGKMSKTLGAADKIGKEIEALSAERKPGSGNLAIPTLPWARR